MAATNASLHIRSISLPSTSHPLDASAENHLRRLRASQAGPSPSSSICRSLFDIKDLYEELNDSISLPHNKNALCKGNTEEVLEGSLALLDASSFALDAVSQMKESVIDLQSSLRRGNKYGIQVYLASRKKISKMASKCLSDMKKTCKNLPCSDDGAITQTMLTEAEAISLSILKSALSFIMAKKSPSRSFVAKLIKSKHASGESGEASEVKEVDNVLRSLSEKENVTETKVLLKQLEALEMVIQELEDGLQSVSRCLLKTRVSLLNVHNY